MDIGPRRDLLGDLATAVRDVVSPHTNKPLKFGAYHSMLEWYVQFKLKRMQGIHR